MTDAEGEPAKWATCRRCGGRIHYLFGAWWDDNGNWPCLSDIGTDEVHVPIGPDTDGTVNANR